MVRALGGVALGLAAGAWAPATGASASPGLLSPVGVHSMLQLNHPFSAKQAMFGQASALGASTIRLDIALALVFADPNHPDWTGVDQDMQLARRYHLRVLADLFATPGYMVDCPPGTPSNLKYECPPSDTNLWGRLAGVVAAHTRGVIDYFEIINEPDGAWSFKGTAAQYAHILASAYPAIHAADPGAHVALGGLMHIGSHTWMNAMLDTPGTHSIDNFDLANIHVRTRVSQVAAVVRDWRHYLAGQGFPGPLWVTETGYPADPKYQTDPAYQNGPASQARWMTTAIAAMLDAGASMVFVTERDALSGRFASEGILEATDPLPPNPTITRRPSYYAVRALIKQRLIA